MATRFTEWGMEYSFHDCPQRFRREVKVLFPSVDPTQIVIIPTRQRSEIDLTDWGGIVEKEKDRLLERFTTWAGGLCEKLMEAGYWADYIDPCSGLPMIDKKCQQPYGEVEGFSILLGYEVTNAGCCKILVHPEWGTNFYPATIFTTAPKEILSQIIDNFESESI